MKIRKERVDNKIIRILERDKKKMSIEDIAIKYGLGRNTIGELLRLKIATQTTVNKIESKQEIPA